MMNCVVNVIRIQGTELIHGVQYMYIYKTKNDIHKI